MTPNLALIGVVGTGTMGAGIAQVALEHGHEVAVHDVDEAALERGHGRIREGLGRRAAKLGLDADSIDDWVDGRLELLRRASTLDALAAEADVVIEAALEDLELKRTIFRALDAAADRPDVVLATNTSALAVRDIAAATARPDRVLGLHFFNPAPLMALVEVVAHGATAKPVVDRSVELVRSWGKTAVRCADAPGFIVNRVNRPFTIEALRMLEAGEGSVEDIDAVMRDGGYPIGPFELMDLAGVDVNLAAARGVWEGLGRPERFRPSSIQERLVEADQLGRKAGLGFYSYEAGRRVGLNLALSALPASSLAGAEIRQRIELAVINEAWHALAEGVAAKEDIDLAMRLGVGHPAGPFERTEALGGRAVVRQRLADLAAVWRRFTPAPGL